jgi:hypothetical protein
MWETAHHLGVLAALDVAEPSPVDTDSGTDSGTSGEDRFDLPYRLKDRNSREGA